MLYDNYINNNNTTTMCPPTDTDPSATKQTVVNGDGGCDVIENNRGRTLSDSADKRPAGYNDEKLSGYELFLATKEKIARAMEGAEKIVVGDCDNKTELVRRISGGSFGEVYLGEMVASGRQVAVKIEPQHFGNQLLLHEGTVYRELEGGPGISKVHWFGLRGSDYAAMTMELLGPTVYELFAGSGNRLSLKSVLQLADQMVEILAHVHRNQYVHRDISPNNFMMGTGDDAGKLFLIDFGCAKKVTASPQFMRTTQPRFHPRKPALVGTPRFASVFAHMGQGPAIRDDMESLGYIWLYLLTGRLVWQGVASDTNEEKLNKIAELKIKTPVEELCKDVPEEFGIYLEHVRSLSQYDKPDYANIRLMFRNLADKHDIEYDGAFDWSAGEKGEERAGHATPAAEEPSNNESANPVSH